MGCGGPGLCVLELGMIFKLILQSWAGFVNWSWALVGFSGVGLDFQKDS